ncbi:hypothetical protein ACFX16_047188 [Malus domestica]
MAEEFLDYHKISEHRRVTVAGLHLSGDAAHWLRWYKMRFPLSSWVTFTTQLLQRFGPADAVNFNMALSHITQTTNVEAYVSQFIRLSCRTPDWTDAQLLGAFLGGLKDELQDDVVAQGQSSLARAIELARIYEHKQGRRPGPRSGSFRSSTYSPKPQLSLPPNPSSPTPTSRTLPLATAHPPTKPILRLTQAEMRTRRKQGLCFNCDDQYRPDHRCRQTHILMLLADEEDQALLPETRDPTPPLFPPVEQPEDPIALNAISATKCARGRAMRLEGFIRHTPIHVFIDSGADQSFLNP